MSRRAGCTQCIGSDCGREVFPVFLKLCDRRVLVVGGGAVAAEKAPALVQAGAIVRVVAPAIRDDLAALAVGLERREFAPSDLDDVWYVVAAGPPEVNRTVAAAAEERRIFVNAVDDRSLADAYLGSVIRRAGMTIAISTNGVAPALTALVRRGLEGILPDDLEGWVQLAEDTRREWKRQGTPFSERRPRLLEAINRWYAHEVSP